MWPLRQKTRGRPTRAVLPAILRWKATSRAAMGIGRGTFYFYYSQSLPPGVYGLSRFIDAS